MENFSMKGKKVYTGTKHCNEHMVHIGKKAPKGWKEISAQHLGRGIWAITCEKSTPHKEGMRMSYFGYERSEFNSAVDDIEQGIIKGGRENFEESLETALQAVRYGIINAMAELKIK